MAEINMQNSVENEALGKKLFSMIVVADTHLSEQDMVSNSPFPVNRLANGRMKYVVQDINALAPDFVINLGDLIHPVPGVPHAYKDAVARFLEQTANLECPQYLVPGNHDVGDKPIDWAPAGVVCDDYLALWEEYFGPHYYAFEHKGIHFLVVNASVINTGMPAEQAQQAWLEDYLRQHAGERFFINIHYPPFLTEPEEPEHYDNIAEPGRSWLLGLMDQYEVEALFAGHVHNFWYNRFGVTDCYLLPSTAFVRQDYSEMYRVPPLENEEHGRNEDAKLGYLQVNVYEHGHVCHSIRTYGQLGGEQTVLSAQNRCTPVHPLEQDHAPLGFDLRQTWSEVLEIPPSGGLDEFIRKPVRNDYPLMALWEMGVKKLRVPLHDLQDDYVRERMAVLQQHGHEFTVFSFGLLNETERDCLLQHQALLSSWELAYASQDLDKVAGQLRSLKPVLDLPVYLSRLHTHADVKQNGDRYFHVINHGFKLDDQSRMQEVLDGCDLRGVIAGFVLRIGLNQSPADAVAAAAEMAATMEMRCSLHLRLAGENPAEANYDDGAIARRIASSLIAAKAQNRVDVFVDTFADNDRGYFVKNGVVDRRYNPRSASLVVSNLYSELLGVTGLQPIGSEQAEHCEVQLFSSDQQVFALVLPEQPVYLKQLSMPCIVEGAARLADLKKGEVMPLEWQAGDNGLLLDTEVLYQHPCLIRWQKG